MILLSFDIEEFDLPLETGQSIPMEEQIRISTEGLERILNLLERLDVKATFYSTATYMSEIKAEVRERLLASDHEIASHGVCHSSFAKEHYLESKLELERITGKQVYGYRMPRMQPIDHALQREAGYLYDSSLHPTWIPGRYCNLNQPRLPHLTHEGIWELPASVTPYFRIPLFWLSLHNMPIGLYSRLVAWTARADAYLNTYFHPWEFADLGNLPYKISPLILRNSGKRLVDRLEYLIKYLRERGETFGTTCDYLQERGISLAGFGG